MKCLCSIGLLLFVFHITSGTHFYFASNPSKSPSYHGYLWKDSTRVHLRPVLQAVAENKNGPKGEICGIVPHGSIEADLPFQIEVLDRKTGIGEIKLKKGANIDFKEESTIVFELVAYDCAEPPNFSEKAPVSVHILNRHGPVFDSLSYQFTISQNSPTGSVVGQVAAIAEFNSQDSDTANKICDYQISPMDVPFTIDRYGVIRVGTGLETLSVKRPLVFQVVAEDCHRPTPLRASVDVRVDLLKQGCQQGWKGLPPDIEYRSPVDKAERLFWPSKPVLETCTRRCSSPLIQTRLELRSAMDESLTQTANSQSCLHDPEHLSKQRKLCKVNQNTLINLLPDPDQDLATQLVRPSLGSSPRVMAPSQTIRFSGSSLSVWELDPRHLSPLQGINAFDTNFTLSFWMRRNIGQMHATTATEEDREETIICSQDEHFVDWRFLSVSFRGCQLIVRIMASFNPEASITDSQPRQASEWVFEPLSEQYCSSLTLSHSQWHHYAITFSRVPWASTTQLISLLIDGHNPGLSQPREIIIYPNPTYTPSERKANPRITIGACFDPATHLSRQHLNAELTGMTLLFDQVESPSILRCMAQCGESLFVPNVLKYLRTDINVTLESDAVTVVGLNTSHVADMLTAITYIRPQPGISSEYTATMAQSRKLKLITFYQCPGEMAISIPTLSMVLNVLPEDSEDHQVEQSRRLDSTQAGSVWLPHDSVSLNRPDMGHEETRAKQSDFSRPPTSTLRISGPDVIVADPSTLKSGIPLFTDIKFHLWDNSVARRAADHMAASVPLDSCNVWLASSGDPQHLVVRPKLHATRGERIEWPTIMASNNGFSGRNNEYGLEIQGRKPAGEYIRLLRELRYWPPILHNDQSSSSHARRQMYSKNEITYMANVELVCVMDAGAHRTSEFIVKVLIPAIDSQSQNRLNTKQMDAFVAMPNGVESVHYAQSDREQRKMPDISVAKLIPVGQDNKKIYPGATQDTPSGSNKGYIAGIVISSLVIVVVVVSVVSLFIFKRDRMHRKLTRVGRRPRVPQFPADFGGSSLKRDPTLRLTANPIGEIDYYGIGTLRENIHGSTMALAPRQHIFSPPTVHSNDRNSYSSGSAHLAGLEEFDEDPLSEGIAESDGNEDLGLGETGPYNEDHEGDGASDFTPSNQFGADIYDWIDDDGLENQELLESSPNQPQQGQRWDLVSQGSISDFGPPAVDL